MRGSHRDSDDGGVILKVKYSDITNTYEVMFERCLPAKGRFVSPLRWSYDELTSANPGQEYHYLLAAMQQPGLWMVRTGSGKTATTRCAGSASGSPKTTVPSSLESGETLEVTPPSFDQQDVVNKEALDEFLSNATARIQAAVPPPGDCYCLRDAVLCGTKLDKEQRAELVKRMPPFSNGMGTAADETDEALCLAGIVRLPCSRSLSLSLSL